MGNIAVSDLRSNLMKVLKQIELGSSIDITSRGKVVAKLVPPDYNMKIAKDRLKAIRKTAILHDVLSPIDDTWEATKS
ncbi:type II toxin-antitoxin system Phd/YefM family antitoxin [bacterium]|nr:type II toxin-antitoxin system Phd/YefM family antitoxin [bacterium]RQV98295.1 MAG: type II toxin-antitoxin system prevent-host-death family antitoxin [bacterium]